MKFLETCRSRLAVYASTSDPNGLIAMAAARVNETGNLALLQSIENSGRLSAMFGIRAAQTNPIEAAAIGSLDRSAAPGNAQDIGLAGALTSILANLASITPKTPTTPVKTS